MTKRVLITKSSSKQAAADALAEAKRRNKWSNADLGDAMDCSEGSVRNRLDDEDVANQMLVHELRRITQVDGPTVANGIFADTNYRLTQIDACGAPVNALACAAEHARTASDLIQALADGQIDIDEARHLLPQMVSLSNSLMGLKAHLRAIIDGTAPKT